jgi:hypothetical protein
MLAPEWLGNFLCLVILAVDKYIRSGLSQKIDFV